jgi:peptide/nickel transport system permease protein
MTVGSEQPTPLAAPEPLATAERSRLGRPRYSALTIAAGCALGLLIAFTFIAPLLLTDPVTQNLADSLKAPGLHGGHLLGTDQLGRDQLSRLASGLRTSLLVCSLSVAIAAVSGTFVGVLSGYRGGWLDDLVGRIADTQLAIPAVLLAMTLVSVLHPSGRTVVIVLSLYGWVIFARVARAQVLAFKTTEIIAATRAFGASDARILLRHVTPNISSPLLALATVQLANFVIIEAALGYLGVGIPPPSPTLGSMIAGGQPFLTTGVWWLTVVPGVTIVILLITINALGDWVRDRLDPRWRTRAR